MSDTLHPLAAETPSTQLEREVKLDAGPRFSLPDLAGALPGVVATPLPDAQLQATYVDTPDLRLMRWGITLRHRHDVVGGSASESGWTLKLPAAAEGVALVRRELSWPGKYGPLPAQIASLVRAQARSAPLGPVAKLRTRRRRIELRVPTGRLLAEVDDDIVSVMDGRRLAARFRQVEVELADVASPQLLDVLLARLTTAGAVPGDDRPKVVRAIGPRAALGPDVVVPELSSVATVGMAVAAAIATGLTRMVRHDPGVRLGDDPEHVHQARVGTRRLRSDLRTFRPLLDPEWVSATRAELGWLAEALGRVRDADVLTARLQAQITTLPDRDARPAAALLRRLAAEREEARSRLLVVLDGDRYVALLDVLAAAAASPALLSAVAAPTAPPSPPRPGQGELVAAAVVDGASGHPPPAATATATAAGPAAASNGPAALVGTRSAAPGTAPSAQQTAWSEPASSELDAARTASVPLLRDLPSGLPLGERPAAEVLPALVRRPWIHLKHAVAALGEDPSDEALHEIRKGAKRLRYAAEAASGVMGKPARRLAAAVAEVQGVLGDLQDAVVAEAWLRGHGGSGSPAQALVAGELVTRQRDQQAACRAAWAGRWRAAAKKRLRTWLGR